MCSVVETKLGVRAQGLQKMKTSLKNDEKIGTSVKGWRKLGYAPKERNSKECRKIGTSAQGWSKVGVRAEGLGKMRTSLKNEEKSRTSAQGWRQN